MSKGIWITFTFHHTLWPYRPFRKESKLSVAVNQIPESLSDSPKATQKMGDWAGVRIEAFWSNSPQ